MVRYRVVGSDRTALLPGHIKLAKPLGRGTFGKVFACHVTTSEGSLAMAIKQFKEKPDTIDIKMQKLISRHPIMKSGVLVPFKLAKCIWSGKLQWVHLMPKLEPVAPAGKWFYNRNLDAAAFALSCPAIFERHGLTYPDIKPLNILKDPERKYSKTGYVLCDCDSALPLDCQITCYGSYPPWPTGPAPWQRNLPKDDDGNVDKQREKEIRDIFDEYMSRPRQLTHAMRFSAIATAYLFLGNIDSSEKNTLWVDRHELAIKAHDAFEAADMAEGIRDLNRLVETTLSFDFPTASDLVA
ncbi:MAG: hypothetical protein ACPGR8_01260 [Limisphaerales bacterium]